MSVVREYYHNQYLRVVEKSLAEHREHTMVVKEEIWTTIMWLSDIGAEPWETEKITEEIGILAAKEEYDLIDMLGLGMRSIMNLEDGINA